jgi:citrate lyase synthetase
MLSGAKTQPKSRKKTIPRKEVAGEVVSASRVRKLLEARDFEAIGRMVPEGSLGYLRNY